LATQSLTVRLGGTRALTDVSIDIAPDTISGIIGPNGAGKSTLLNAVSGLVPITSGEIFLHGQKVTSTASHKMARIGLGRSFQGVQFVKGLSVVENVMTGDHLQDRSSLLGSVFRLPGMRRSEAESRARAMHALETVGVGWAALREIGELPFGVQKRVDIARALISQPSCLLLDEPLAGLSVTEKQEVAEVVKQLNAERGLSIILVEHDMRLVNFLCSYIVVLDAGEVLGYGEPAEVLARPEVTEAYVGRPESG
jgi:ABC-type branched-subunit amino acid transport system ATPase component